MDEGWSQVFQTKFTGILLNPINHEVDSSSPHKVVKSLCFGTSINFKAFFDKYFVVKSCSRFSKLLVEFNEDSKTGRGFKIRIP
jgi:hypothetical protein